MTKHDLPDADLPSDGAILLKRAVLGVGGGLALLFVAGVIAGYASVVLKRGPSPVEVAILAAMFATGGAIGYGIWRTWPRSNGEPEALRVKSARRIMVAAVILSLPLGVLLALNDEPLSFFSNSPIDPTIGLIALAVWLIPMPVMNWLWLRRVDEHEANAYRDSASIAMHTYVYVAPAWWIGTRAGFLPQQDPLAVLVLVCLVWSAAWFTKRYF